jgi:hypothetical protein
MQTEKIIKICVDPCCEAIYHNIPKKVTHCFDCNGNLIVINEQTYLKKFSNNFFQYDYNTMQYYYPNLKPVQLLLF